MHDASLLGQDWVLILQRARRQRTEHLRGWASGGPARLASALLATNGPRVRVGLVVLAIFGLIKAGHDGGHSATVMVAICLASVISSIAGFAFSAICGAILFHFHDDPVQIVQIMIVCSIANQASMTWASRHDIAWRGLRVYLLGGAPGLAIGVWILLNMDRGLYAHGFGAALLLYGVYMLVRKPFVVRHPPVALDLLAGFLGGITGGAAGFPGAFVTIWCGMKGWSKARQRAVFQPFILSMQVAALLAISLLRPAGTGMPGFDIANLLFVPASLAGTWAGLALYGRMSDLQFGRAVNLLLIASGLSYVV